ncbi:MAG: thrombospondin, partial [Rhodospirillaceae bacterium]
MSGWWHDADSDGIQDHLDNCPTLRETYNKFQDDDGCPDFIADNKLTADTDGDGIVDYLDLCPTQPETFNGFLDGDG